MKCKQLFAYWPELCWAKSICWTSLNRLLPAWTGQPTVNYHTWSLMGQSPRNLELPPLQKITLCTALEQPEVWLHLPASQLCKTLSKTSNSQFNTGWMLHKGISYFLDSSSNMSFFPPRLHQFASCYCEARALLLSCISPLGQSLAENCFNQRCFLLLEHLTAVRNQASCQLLNRVLLYYTFIVTADTRETRTTKTSAGRRRGEAWTLQILSARVRH